jgi:hypothetical protein
MAAFILIALFVIFFLVAKYGVDSRHVEHGRHRPNWS